jgi:hypothetical protein
LPLFKGPHYRVVSYDLLGSDLQSPVHETGASPKYGRGFKMLIAWVGTRANKVARLCRPSVVRGPGLPARVLAETRS